MTAPVEDFGLGPIETLSRVADPTPAPDHSAFWSRWRKRVQDPRPHLGERAGGTGLAEPDPSDLTATHAFESLGLRIGARLQTPEGTPKAAVVSTHGYAASLPLEERDSLFAPLVEQGVAVLNIRVRGFAGSRLDCGDLTEPTEPGLGWITRGLDAQGEPATGADDWAYAGAIADLFNACRAMRVWLNEHASERAPLCLHGESFGGGLAVAAAALLPGRPGAVTTVDRLVLGLPTMGDWIWRLGEPGQSGAGAGDEVRTLIERRPDSAETIRARLRFADSVTLARDITCPVLCKLALRDAVVPAPTAAAVFNALGVDPGLKWRFVVPVGHAESGIANARRHALFERCAAAFLDPTNEPREIMADWEDRLFHTPESRAEAGASGDTGTLFGGDHPGGEPSPEPDPVAKLVKTYERIGRTLDDLPYTEDFDDLFKATSSETGFDQPETIRKLQNLRKAGKLPRLGKTATKPVKLEPHEESQLAGLVVEAVGTLGQRDSLLYKPEFDAIIERFNADTGRNLSPHAVWRLVAKLAK
ncbi:MAG: acetylxylan esterase [Planctomycetota bacterium]